MNKIAAFAGGGVALLVVGSCASAADDTAKAPKPHPTVTVTETVTPTPTETETSPAPTATHDADVDVDAPKVPKRKSHRRAWNW